MHSLREGVVVHCKQFKAGVSFESEFHVNAMTALARASFHVCKSALTEFPC